MYKKQLLMRRPFLDELPAPPAVPSTYTVRAYTPADLAGLAALMTEAAETGVHWDEERVRHGVVEASGVEQVYLVILQGAPVSTASARVIPQQFPGSGYVHW